MKTRRRRASLLKLQNYKSDKESEFKDEDMAMIARKFKKNFKKSNKRKKFRNFKNQRKRRKQLLAMNARSLAILDQSVLFLNKLKKKAMVATWDDHDEETSDERNHMKCLTLHLWQSEKNHAMSLMRYIIFQIMMN